VILTMKKVVILILFIFTFNVISLAGTVSFTLDSGQYNSPPEPRLRHPIYDTVIIENDQALEFGWWIDSTDTGGFILKIYKGYNMYADNLILKENLPADVDSFKVKTDLFEDGKVYTWSLIRTSLSGYKSDKSFNSFKIIKKNGNKK